MKKALFCLVVALISLDVRAGEPSTVITLNGGIDKYEQAGAKFAIGFTVIPFKGLGVYADFVPSSEDRVIGDLMAGPAFPVKLTEIVSVNILPLVGYSFNKESFNAGLSTNVVWKVAPAISDFAVVFGINTKIDGLTLGIGCAF